MAYTARQKELDKNTQLVISQLIGKTDAQSKNELNNALALRAMNGLSPSDAELKMWGITREQYRSMFNKAKSDWEKNTSFFTKLISGDSTNEVNQYLYRQMIKSNGAYALDAISPTLGASKNVKSTTPLPDTVSGESKKVSAGGSGGGGSSIVKAVEPTYYTADELAKRFGIVNDYATILKELQDATNAKFDETETTMKRAESANLRSQETAYNQYLQDLRSRAANAVASGATKGTMAANALASLLVSQDTNREGINTLNDLLYDIAQQRGTALKADVTTARQQANEIGQYLGNLATSMDTNAINKYAAELAANAQTRAASTNAAKIAADAGFNQILTAFRNDYENKGFDTKAANALANTALVDIIKNYYNPTK
jgi:hypothetical protein